MSKKQKKGKTNWQRMTPSIPAGEWLKALGIAAAMGLSWLFSALPLLREISGGTRVIILTVALAALAAYLFPVKEEETP